MYCVTETVGDGRARIVFVAYSGRKGKMLG